MKKLPLIALIAVTPAVSQASIVKASESFSYMAGGLQYTNLNNKVVSSVYYDTGSYHDKSADNLAGLYVRGSWNFTGNLFAELRSDIAIRETLALSHGLLGVGYYQPLSNSFTLYGLAGLARMDIEQDVQCQDSNSMIQAKHNNNGLTGEIGARVAMTDHWSIEPAARIAGYDKNLQEFRLGNNFHVSNHMNIEVNALKRSIADIKEVNYQIGARYEF